MSGKTQRKVLVIGCGASGMMAAVAAASAGAHVTVLEKNEKAGKKLYITGKGRCNLTNDCEAGEILSHTLRGAKFLYSAVYGFDASRVRHFFTERGCALKTERGNRVFPVSDKASDVIAALVYEMRRLGVRVVFDTPVQALRFSKEELPEGKNKPSKRVTGVVLADGKTVDADAVIVATGGLSYPSTGSTGDGYAFAKAAGHSVSVCYPSLVPMETRETWCCGLQGLTLKNVRLSRGKQFDEQGELLFTHFGISGPLVLTAGACLKEEDFGGHPGNTGNRERVLLKEGGVRFFIDLKPGLSKEQLDARLIREFRENGKKHFVNSLNGLFPAALVPVMAELAAEGIGPEDGDGNAKPVRIDPSQKAGEITAVQRRAFGELIKGLPVTATALRGFREAVITRGGVSCREINPSTMESRLCRGLFFAGEVIDCDARTGGYNLQIAWSTGELAGRSCAGKADG